MFSLSLLGKSIFLGLGGGGHTGFWHKAMKAGGKWDHLPSCRRNVNVWYPIACDVHHSSPAPAHTIGAHDVRGQGLIFPHLVARPYTSLSSLFLGSSDFSLLFSWINGFSWMVRQQYPSLVFGKALSLSFYPVTACDGTSLLAAGLWCTTKDLQGFRSTVYILAGYF